MKSIDDSFALAAENRFRKKELNDMTDEELVCMYIDGNNSAFDTILKRYENKVFTYLLCTVKNQELAEDLFQDIFIKVVVRIKKGQYSEHGKFSSWLMRIVHNHVIDFYRTSPAETIISNDAGEYDILNDHNIAVNENREQEMIDHQTMHEIKELIDLLPETQRDVVLMRYFEELSFKEIAEKKNCSINTALGRMHYAINNLRKMAYERGINLAS